MTNAALEDRALSLLLEVALLFPTFQSPLAGVLADWGALKAALLAVGVILIVTASSHIRSA